MRIAKNTVMTLTEAPTSRFMLVVDVMDGDILLKKEDRVLLSLALDADGSVVARLSPRGEELTLVAPGAARREVILTASYARFGLYVDGVLMDEDFFFTPLDYLGAELHAGSFMHFEAGYEYHSMPESAIVENVADSFADFCPKGREMALRHPIPTVIGERLHVFYLDERRGGSVKRGMGARRFGALFTPNGEDICSAPIALPIDSIEEKTMVDAAPLTVDGRTYLYYLVDYRGGRALSCAVSDDGFSYLKTGLDIEIPNADAEKMTSIAAYRHNGTPCLLYVEDGKAFTAKSIDLLHFEAPTPLPFADGVADLSVLPLDETLLFFGEREGRAAYAVGTHGEWKPLTGASSAVRAALYHGEICAFGSSEGRLTSYRFRLENDTLLPC